MQDNQILISGYLLSQNHTHTMKNFHLAPLFFFAILFLIGTSCGYQSMPRATGPGYGDYGGETIGSSLFDYKERSISEVDIQRILDGKIKLQDTVRVVIYHDMGSSANTRGMWHAGFDEERLKSNQAMIDSLSIALRRSGRVGKVILMPSMMVGNAPDIHRLRESAVRLQADMLLVFSLKADLFYRYKSFKKDDAKAYATCQSVLMDIRTGVIPHTEVVTREFYGKKEPGDLTLDDMRRRVQNQAMLLTISETGRSVERFFRSDE